MYVCMKIHRSMSVLPNESNCIGVKVRASAAMEMEVSTHEIARTSARIPPRFNQRMRIRVKIGVSACAEV